MATLSDLKWQYRVFLKSYPYRAADWFPGGVLGKPLSAARLAVVTTAAFHLPHQAPFDHDIKGGDCSFRILPADADLNLLQSSHTSAAFDHRGIETDRNLALPLDRLKELIEEKKLGGIASRHLSFLGSITAPGRLLKQTAPQAVEILKEDQVDAVLLTPV